MDTGSAPSRGCNRAKSIVHEAVDLLSGELDRDTRAPGKEAQELRRPPGSSGLAYWICFCFGNPRRGAGAPRSLAEATVPVATATPGPKQRPHDAKWAPVGRDGVPLRLAELVTLAIPPESEKRIAETQAYLRRGEDQRPSAAG